MSGVTGFEHFSDSGLFYTQGKRLDCQKNLELATTCFLLGFDFDFDF